MSQKIGNLGSRDPKAGRHFWHSRAFSVETCQKIWSHASFWITIQKSTKSHQHLQKKHSQIQRRMPIHQEEALCYRKYISYFTVLHINLWWECVEWKFMQTMDFYCEAFFISIFFLLFEFLTFFVRKGIPTGMLEKLKKAPEKPETKNRNWIAKIRWIIGIDWVERFMLHAVNFDAFAFFLIVLHSDFCNAWYAFKHKRAIWAFHFHRFLFFH